MKNLCLLILVLGIGNGPAHSQLLPQMQKPVTTTLISRVDLVDKANPYYTEAVLTPHVEIWAFGWNSKAKNQELWVGHLFKAGKHLSLGGYGVEFPDRSQHYLLPWLAYRDSLGSAKFCLDMGYYLPLNGGKVRLLSPETSIVWPLGNKVDLGIVASTLKVGSGSMPIRLGPTLRLKIGKSALKLNWGAFSVNGAAPSRLRIQVSSNF